MISFSKQPAANVLVNNPILFEIESSTKDAVRVIVRVEKYHAIGNYFAFEGLIFPSLDMDRSKYYCSINISEILQSFLPDISIQSQSLLVSEVIGFSFGFNVSFYGEQYEEIFYEGKFFHGGIGKKMLRYLNTKNTEIFAYKLLNPNQQFFLTTRTSGRHIVLKENELTSLYFIATDKAYTVVTEYGNTFTFPALVSGKTYAFNIGVLRQLSYNTYKKIPSYLVILVDGKYVFDITIKEAAKSPNKYVIEFLNSFSAPEKLEVTGKTVSEPEFGEDNAFMIYDRIIDDYIEQNNRLGIREIIKAEFGYKSLDEFLFMRDMLQSDKRYLIDQSGNRSEIRVSCENFSHDIFPNEPGSVQLKIKFIDSDSNYSPGIDESLPDFNFGEAIWQFGVTNGYGFLFVDSTLNTI
jgi:hypothetical protein